MRRFQMDSSSNRGGGVWSTRGGRGRGGRAGGSGSGKDPWKRQDQNEFRPQGPIRMAVRPTAVTTDADSVSSPSPSETPAFRILQPAKSQSPPIVSPEDPTPTEAQHVVRPLAKPTVQASSSSGSVNGIAQATPTRIAAPPKQSARPAPTNAMLAGAMPQSIMDLSSRFIDENNEICDITEFLTESTAFTVIGVIGPQGTGKSTLLSMIAGNEPMDMYREYFFRPCSREAVESCLHQTTKISVYVGQDATIYIDCQPCMSPAILDELIRQQRRGYCSYELTPETHHEEESNRLLAFMFQMCHTIILCIDWFIDINIVRELRNVELLATAPAYHDRTNEMFRVKQNRKVNLVVVQQRCKVEDFQPVVVLKRSQLLSKLFAGSRLRVDGGLTMAKLHRKWVDEDEPVQANYILFPDLKPRQREGFHYGSNNHRRNALYRDNYDPDRDLKNLKMGVVEYTDALHGIRRTIKTLPKDSFTMSGNRITEKQWFVMASRTWRKLNERSLNPRSRYF
uniref:Protein SMG9 n=1 Tax=Steinernema glaseri TaxID=37863 RepID=A0A1I7Z7H3_9BILA